MNRYSLLMSLGPEFFLLVTLSSSPSSVKWIDWGELEKRHESLGNTAGGSVILDNREAWWKTGWQRLKWRWRDLLNGFSCSFLSLCKGNMLKIFLHKSCYARPKLSFSFSLSPSSLSLSSSFTTGFLSGRNSVAMVISISVIGMAQCGRPAGGGGGGGGGVIFTFLNIRRGRLCQRFHPPSVSPLCVVDHMLKLNF